MAAPEPDALGMAHDVTDSERDGVGDEHAQYTPPGRRCRCVPVLVHDSATRSSARVLDGELDTTIGLLTQGMHWQRRPCRVPVSRPGLRW